MTGGGFGHCACAKAGPGAEARSSSTRMTPWLRPGLQFRTNDRACCMVTLLFPGGLSRDPWTLTARFERGAMVEFYSRCPHSGSSSASAGPSRIVGLNTKEVLTTRSGCEASGDGNGKSRRGVVQLARPLPSHATLQLSVVRRQSLPHRPGSCKNKLQNFINIHLNPAIHLHPAQARPGNSITVRGLRGLQGARVGRARAQHRRTPKAMASRYCRPASSPCSGIAGRPTAPGSSCRLSPRQAGSWICSTHPWSSPNHGRA